MKLSTLNKTTLFVLISVFIVPFHPATSASLNLNSKNVELVNTSNVALRGYGKVDCKQYLDKKSGSILQISCESEEKARLTLAKYISDLQLLPGIQALSKQSLPGNANAIIYEIKDQGVITAFRSNTDVFILASTSKTALAQLFGESMLGDKDKVVFSAETTVPMWLDRWDKYGFRFYYGPFALPQKDQPFLIFPEGQTRENYNFVQELEFAKKHGTGLVLWLWNSKSAYGEGLDNESRWLWIEKWIEDNKLPVGLNISAYSFTVPHWIANRYRERLAYPMPQFLGNSFSIGGVRGNGGNAGELQWGSDVQNIALGALQQMVKAQAKRSNITTWLEPHGEIPSYDYFINYGPEADLVYRDFLKKKYGDITKLNSAWFGKAKGVASWNEVKAPELAHFAGWGPQAFDLCGAWKILSYKNEETPLPDYFQPTFDDSKWLQVQAPGDDNNFFILKQPAVYRRTFDLPQDWLKKNSKVWIYLWDLNLNQREKKAPPVTIYLNGAKIAESPADSHLGHWMTADVSTSLKAGSNQITLILPLGYLGYRIYLSPVEPNQYPNLGEGLNAQWVDYILWKSVARLDSVRKGTEMIRQVDPNAQIDYMHPDDFADGVKEIIHDFGGNFKNTGFMGGTWADSNPSWMRSSGLPFSLEPGGPSGNLEEFKTTLGLWHTEGINGVDYFIHLQWVSLFPEILKHYEYTKPMWDMIGKYHVPQGEMAFFWSTNIAGATGYPWGYAPNTNLSSGWSCHGMTERILQDYPRDSVTEGDFARGVASKYKVLIDTNTSIMDEETLKQIEKYVKDGGIFVTFAQTGRHTPTIPNSWPISKLTGYEVLTTEKFNEKGQTIGKFAANDPAPGSPTQILKPAPNQTVYPQEEPWMSNKFLTGLRLKKVAPEAQDLALWNDGTVAIGMRKIGKGYIVQFGCKNDGSRWLGIDTVAFNPLLKWAGVKANSWKIEAPKSDYQFLKDYIVRHYISNNGLYDIWVLWNPNKKESTQLSLIFQDRKPTTAWDVLKQTYIPVQDGQLKNITLEPVETKMFLTPRNEITQAPQTWLTLQQGWWQGTKKTETVFPQPTDRFVREFSDNWAWHAMEGNEAPPEWVTPDFDDSSWERMKIGVWLTPDNKHNTKQAIFRKKFTVPKEWNKGRVVLAVDGSAYPAFSQEGRIWLDGKMIKKWGNQGFNNSLDGTFQPGSTHTLAVEVRSQSNPAGFLGDAWLAYVPAPESSIDLSGKWTGIKDMQEIGEFTFPGEYSKIKNERSLVFRRSVTVPKEHEGKNIVLNIGAEVGFHVIINGFLIRYNQWPAPQENIEFNITPWIKFGAENRIELLSTYDHCKVQRVALDIYDKKAYP